MSSPNDPQQGGNPPLPQSTAGTPFRGRPVVPQPLGREPRFDVPAEVLDRYNAKVLDPRTAVRLPGQAPVRPTVYLADRLLVSGVAEEAARDTLTEVVNGLGLSLVPPLVGPRRVQQRADLASAAGIAAPSPLDTVAVQLVPTASAAPVAPPDAWTVLQTFRGVARQRSVSQQTVALDHLLTSSMHTSGHPFIPHSGDADRLPMDSYGSPGWGGRAPVAWLGGLPHRRPDEQCPGRRPVVAILDTGVGQHPWLTPDVVTKNPSVNGVPIGLQDAATDPEVTGVLTDPLEGVLDSDAGHGTFISGLIRQRCPDADILSIRVMPSDGAVPEHVLLDALNLLALRQQLAQKSGDASQIVDIVSLSLGYYHELPEDLSFDPVLLHPLNLLAASGAIIVAAAGNDATTRPLFPAAFAPYPGGPVPVPAKDVVPVTAVGALNPDQTIALFSNAGPWVRAYRTGADLVSTFPVTFNGSGEPSNRLYAIDGWRETIDPDDFASGFGTWSGTSFSAPVLAGEIAQTLIDGAYGPLGPVDQSSMLDRSWAAITAHTHLSRP